MRKALIGAVVLVLSVGVAIRAQDQPSPLDTPTTLRLPASLPTCGVDTVIMKLARVSHVVTGFEESLEESPECSGHFARVNVTYVNREQSSLTVRQVLDQLIALSPNSQWVEMDGVAVIRPATAWADASNVLNGRVAPLHVADATMSDTLDILLRRRPSDSPPPGFAHFNFNKPPFAIAFNGGTFVEALNALALSAGNAGWMARVVHASGAGGAPALQLVLRTFNVGDRTGVDGAISTGAPLSRMVAAR